ncbi:3896_t:CDS:2 [Funneliformis mosseae]|uniref:3896_t:CDS:1 n=1 Tax=Funneliformis mosseae TaxID=27381 RepID=A0A9N9AC38_FUNMO|nr:3896_t:CDS:2 [Funneliformis mosseae]
MSATKLGILLVRTLAKPIANSIKNYSKRHATFRQMCINVAQATHRFEIKLKMNLLSQKSEKIRPLNDAKAVEMGANFLGEAVIFGVANRQHQLNEQIEKLQEETTELKSHIEINRSFEDRMMNQLEELKNDNEKLRTLLDRILIKGLEPRKSQILRFPGMQWENKDDNKNPQDQNTLENKTIEKIDSQNLNSADPQ